MKARKVSIRIIINVDAPEAPFTASAPTTLQFFSEETPEEIAAKVRGYLSGPVAQVLQAECIPVPNGDEKNGNPTP